MRSRLPFLAIVLMIGIFVLVNSLFTVRESHQALVLRFGEPIRTENADLTVNDAGLKFKWPFIDKVVQFDRRNLELDMEPEEILASDQERLLVDAFIRYHITDIRQFYETLRNQQRGESQMKRIMDSTLRDVLGRVSSNEIISGKRSDLMNEIQEIGNRKAGEDNWGLEVIDVRIRTADLPQQNAERVFERMRTDREKESAEKLAEGEKRAITIRAEADKQVTVTIAKAKEQSEILKGQGEAKKNEVLAKVYSLDPEFADFYLKMDAYETTLTKGTTFIMSPDSDFLGYLDDQGGGKR